MALVASTVSAEVVVNEVLANEPGSMTSLEWIELYNCGEAVSLDGYELHSDEDIITLPADVTLDSGEYFIVCRRLYRTDGTPAFEAFWGDGSGVWGDTDYESSFQIPLEASFSLTNDSGSVTLRHNSSEVSSLSWSRSGGDGDSWERALPLSDSIGQSTDPIGSTPGFLNSLTPADYDLAIVDVNVTPRDGGSMVTFTIANVGLSEVAGAQLYVTDTNGVDTIGVKPVETMAPGDTVDLVGEYWLDERYVMLVAVLSHDDRDRNNDRRFLAVGSDYPPVIITEFLANPTSDFSCEWVEIFNQSNDSVNLFAWRLGDSLRQHTICEYYTPVGPGEYVVVVQSEEYFRAGYPDFDGLCFEALAWAALNNDGDIVVLVDSYNLELDRFAYSTAFEDNYTWSRVIDGVDAGKWGRSEFAGGTPGAPNAVTLVATGSSMVVELSSPYVSPDGDGFEDVVDITIEAPPASSFTARIYDRQGRVVRHLYDHERYLPSQVEWDGLSDAGRRLPIGMYILCVEAAGVQAVKKPIVVAR